MKRTPDPTTSGSEDNGNIFIEQRELLLRKDENYSSKGDGLCPAKKTSTPEFPPLCTGCGPLAEGFDLLLQCIEGKKPQKRISRLKMANKPAFAQGAQVEHPKFGLGSVLSCNEDYIVIKFDDHGEKKFVLSIVLPNLKKSDRQPPVEKRRSTKKKTPVAAG
jgi:hypothetical protein